MAAHSIFIFVSATLKNFLRLAKNNRVYQHTYPADLDIYPGAELKFLSTPSPSSPSPGYQFLLVFNLPSTYLVFYRIYDKLFDYLELLLNLVHVIDTFYHEHFRSS
ncbi:hypothetical protein HGRIS_013888 [Hohenbuehelia grisea]|uniref:Uncharacterized protein n=1 Tax=Hohenbuehelia grisea TaxID=104357 RepID=A0ABR3IX81_9AGAR